MSCMAAIDPRHVQLVLSVITDHSPKPTELLEILASQLSYTEIQDAMSELLEAGTVELGSDRRLCAVRSAAADLVARL